MEKSQEIKKHPLQDIANELANTCALIGDRELRIKLFQEEVQSLVAKAKNLNVDLEKEKKKLEKVQANTEQNVAAQ